MILQLAMIYDLTDITWKMLCLFAFVKKDPQIPFNS